MEEFDQVLLSQVRLGVVSVLLERGETTFSDLKALLGLTQGNLGDHIGKLEDAGYIRVDKAFADRKPRTSCTLTDVGRKAFLAHVAMLTKIAKRGSRKDT